MVGVWKAGAIAVSVNPMLKQRELELLLRDSGAAALVCLEGLYESVARDVVGATDVRTTITTSELEYQSRNDQRVFGAVERIACEGTLDMAGMLSRFAGRKPAPVSLDLDDVAVLTYTSGTTGPPKGAMNTHRNVVFNAQTYRDWIGLGGDDVILGVAPLFHITGLIGHLAISLLIGAPLVLTYRLEPSLSIDTIRETGATFTVGAITVFIALMNAPNADRDARRSRRARSRRSPRSSGRTSTTSTASPRPPRRRTACRSVRTRRWTRRPVHCRSGCRSTTQWSGSSATTARTCRPVRSASW